MKAERMNDVRETTERNKRVVESYFQALDGSDVSALPALFSADCLIHRPGLTEPLKGLEGIGSVVAGVARRYRKFETEIVSILVDGDMVACRLTHRVEFSASWSTRLGKFDVSGRSIVWHPIVLFRLSDGRIVEQWVCRDELGMLIDLGILKAAM